MTRELRAEASPSQRGLTILSTRALHRLVAALVRDAAQVPLRDVLVTLTDRSGELHATVTLPLGLPLTPAQRLGETCAARGAVLRDAVIGGLSASAHRQVGSVDVRFSGVYRAPARVIW